MGLLKSMRRPFIRALAKSVAGSGTLAASVIIATHNKASYLDLTLAALERQALPMDCWQVVVVDDASDDNTGSVIREYQQHGRISIISMKSDRIRGRSGARNDALAVASGKIAVFLDDDRIVPSDFLLQHLVRHRNEAYVVYGDTSRRIHTHLSPKIDAPMWQLSVLLNSENQPKQGGRSLRRIVCPEDLDDLKKLDVLAVRTSSEQQYYEEIKVLTDLNVPWFFFTTGNSSVSRQKLDEVGGFDEGYRGWGFEDNDLAYRLLKSGCRFLFEPKAYDLHQLHTPARTQVADHKRNMKRFFAVHPELFQTGLEPLFQGNISVRDWARTRSTRQFSNSNVPVLTPSTYSLAWCIDTDDLWIAHRASAIARELRSVSPQIAVTFFAKCKSAELLARLGHHVISNGEREESSPFTEFEALKTGISNLRPNLVVLGDRCMHRTVASVLGIPAMTLPLPHKTKTIRNDIHVGSNGQMVQKADRVLNGCTPTATLSTSIPMQSIRQINPANNEMQSLLKGDGQRLLVINVDIAPTEPDGVPNLVATALSICQTHRIIVISNNPAHYQSLGELFSNAIQAFATGPETFDILLSADFVIARGNTTMLAELAHAGVPSVSIPNGGDKVSQSFAMEMAALGSTVYLPEALATPDNMTRVLSEALSPCLVDAMKAAAQTFDFSSYYRNAASQILSGIGGS